MKRTKQSFTTFITLAMTLACAALACAATMTVSNVHDSGAGSLRQALADANDGDTIDFDSSLNGQTITLTSGELLVDKSVSINGPGPNNLVVDGNYASRVFYVTGGVTAAVSGLSITNGSADGGGGIINVYSMLTVDSCTLSGNWAGAGGGIYNEAEFGSATLTVTNSTLSGNSAYNFGGGIFNDAFYGSTTVTVTNSTFSGNSANVNGGGIYNFGEYGSATLTVTNSTLSGNSASGFGGAIVNDGYALIQPDQRGATLTVTNSTLSGNSAGSFGGGVFNDSSWGSATLTVTNSTLSGNSANFGGGGIYNNVENPGSATLTIESTILKTGLSGENISFTDGTVTSDGYNLSNDDGGGFLTATGDQINTGPMLGPLQDNGGPTLTHALLPGSPAIDAGDPTFTPPPNYDQRGPGYDRVVNGRIDIGAFEVQTVAPSYAAQVQPPINADGTSIFSTRRGVVPVKFNLSQGGVATCDLPPATIAVTRTGGGVIGEINESVYSGNADTGSNFRIDSCQYVYNLNSRALGVGTYRVDIQIDGDVVGSATFELN